MITCTSWHVNVCCRDALDIQYDILNLLNQLEEEHQFPKIYVELIDNEPSSVYAASKKSAQVWSR